MNEFIKKNINIIISIFILLIPILDLLTGLCLHVLNINFTLGIIIKVLFLVFIMYTSLFIFKKKKLLIPYLLVFIYGLFYVLGNILYKDSSIFTEVQNLFKTFFFPLFLISIYSIKDNIKISKMVLLTTMFTYLICIFIPTLLGIGYKTYEITKAGTLGFYNSANEISGVISLITPIMFIIFAFDKGSIKKTILTLIYLVVILMMGTKTPLLSLFITIGMTILYLWTISIKKKNYKPVLYTFMGLVVAILALIIIIPKTNFYKNIETHLNYLKLDNIYEVFESPKLIDHFIFSQRLTFLKNKYKIYDHSNTYEKVFGIGYINNNKTTKLIEMDYFDILFSHGIIGFILYFSLVIPIIISILKQKSKLTYERYMYYVSFTLIVVLAFFTGHIITAPTVSIIACIIILYLDTNRKKDLVFSSVSLDLGGIEKALLNLVNRIDYNKYNVTIILERKEGIFLDKVNKEVTIKELKVNNNNNVIIRKSINLITKSLYKLFNYKNYDFSCCYATYSYSSSKIALISSYNTSIYVHSNYKHLYKDINEYKSFFNTRNIYDYKKIIFVSNESKNDFIDTYKDLSNKCITLNNFVDTKEIIKLSKEKVEVNKNKKDKYLLFVGRIDDSSKKLFRQIEIIKNINNINLWIVGDGPDKHKYMNMVKKEKLEDRVTFFGSKENPYPYMIEADYIILTSDYEGFPVTYLEALTLNKKIITTIPTSDDYIDIKNIAYIISKDNYIEEVKEIIKDNKDKEIIDLEKYQTKRMKDFENLFNGVI